MDAKTWDDARATVHGSVAPLPTVQVPLAEADGTVLASPLATLTDIPAFDTSSVDGYAVRGSGPWRLAGKVLAGAVPDAVEHGTAVVLATGAMVPPGTDHVLRVENTSESTVDGTTLVHGEPPERRDWRDAGEEAARGEELFGAGTVLTPAVIGLAASCGYDTLTVHRRPRAEVLVFGDELLTVGPPRGGRIRDSLGPALPAWLRRLGADVVGPTAIEPVQDTLDAHIAALRTAADRADVVVTTGGTMHGPVDHLHPALAALGAEYVVDTVKVRPGFPMLAARLPDGTQVAGLPGNPQSATVALVTLVMPLLAGLRGLPMPRTTRVRLGADIPGRGDFTHLAIVRLGGDGLAYPLAHVGSAMLRGVAAADGFAVVRPGQDARAGAEVDLAPLPLTVGEPLLIGERS
jgi:molybdopterin molybdotransferase